MNPIKVDISWIGEYLSESNSTANFSDFQIRRIAAIAASMVEKGSAGKISATASKLKGIGFSIF
ncbi:MAG: hypothetical protein LBU32_26370 [Clostridiales bacterium]|jgi:hypothetical protein|nr:hypothetical protein [Clostridiales bacterium]